MSDAPAIVLKSEQSAASLMINGVVKEPNHKLEIFEPRIDFTLFYILEKDERARSGSYCSPIKHCGDTTLVGTNRGCALFKFNRVYIGLFGDKDSSLLII